MSRYNVEESVEVLTISSRLDCVVESVPHYGGTSTETIKLRHEGQVLIQL